MQAESNTHFQNPESTLVQTGNFGAYTEDRLSQKENDQSWLMSSETINGRTSPEIWKESVPKLVSHRFKLMLLERSISQIRHFVSFV